MRTDCKGFIKQGNVPLGAAARVRGFTLLELLVVITIIGLLMALATPFMVDTIAASRLTMAGSNLEQYLSLAQQEALTRNQPVEVRFFRYDFEGQNQIRAYQIFVQERRAIGEPSWEPMGNPEFFGDGDVVIAEGALSPMFAGGGQAVTSDMEPFSSKTEATYYAIRYGADGSTQINQALADSYFTLILEKNLSASADPPPNFYTIQLDPVTGRTRSYRP